MPLKTKWWQKLGAAAAGGVAGYVNAAGRTRVDAGPAIEGITGVTGHKRRLADWQGQVDTANAAVQGEQQKAAIEQQAARLAAEGEIRQRQMKVADAQLARANRPAPAPAPPPPGFQARFNEAKASGASDEEARVYASGGHLAVAPPVKPEKPAAPTFQDRYNEAKAAGSTDEESRVYASGGHLSVKQLPAASAPGRAGSRGLAGPANPGDERLVKTIMNNPALWNNLTKKTQERISPLLEDQGFTEFGKAPNESAMGKAAESRSAIESLKDLRQTLKENEQYIGPLAGWQKLNPYSEARNAQAKIDLVKQRVGKALEGGVLRKEDEEKYKIILAKLTDTPELAIAKVDNLITTLERDMELFNEEQRRGGRNFPSSSKSAPPHSGGATPAAPKTAEEYLKSLGR